MKKQLILLIISFFCLRSEFISAQASNVLRHQRTDFEQFYSAFNATQAQADLHFSRDSITKELEILREKMRSPLSPLEQFRVYSLFLSKLQSGHTSISPNKAALKEWYDLKQCLPFDVVMVNKRLFVSPLHPFDYSKETPESIYKKELEKKLIGGVEIVSIDKKSIAEWMQVISPYISSDEDNIDFKYVVAGQYFDFYRYVALSKFQRVVEIRYVVKKDTLSLKVDLGSPNIHTVELRLKPTSAKENGYEFEILNSKIGYFKFTSFIHANSEEYSSFLKKSFEEMYKKKIKKLIIDVRGNFGGQIQYELMSYFLKSPKDLGTYTYEKILSKKELKNLGFDLKDFSAKSYLKTDKIAANRQADKKTSPAISSLQYKGDIVVLTDEGTFSAAAVLAAHLKTICDAKIVGEMAGGTFYATNSGTLSLELRKSKFKISLNPNFFTTQLYNPNKTAIDSMIKTPDVIQFSESFVPDEKFQEIPKKKKSLDDPVVKQAIKTFREFD